MSALLGIADNFAQVTHVRCFGEFDDCHSSDSHDITCE